MLEADEVDYQMDELLSCLEGVVSGWGQPAGLWVFTSSLNAVSTSRNVDYSTTQEARIWRMIKTVLTVVSKTVVHTTIKNKKKKNKTTIKYGP